MEVIKIAVSGAHAKAMQLHPVTTGMAGAEVEFSFGPEWAGLTRTAVFRAGAVAKDVVLTSDVALIPPEVLVVPASLYIGVYGCNSKGTLVIPTIMAQACYVRAGADPSGDESTDFTLPVWQQLLSRIGPMDELGTEAKDSLVAAINEVIRVAGGDIDPEVIAAAVTEYLAANPIKETDPTVPAWAKQPTKPGYTAAEVGAQPKGDYALRGDLPGAVVFHLSYVDEIYGYSHTVEELYSAYQKGANITCVCDISSVRVFNLKTATDTEIVFECLDVDGEAKRTRISRIVYTEGNFTVETDSVAVPTVPTKVSAFANDKGYQTATEVNALINTALGVIENGTY